MNYIICLIASLLIKAIYLSADDNRSFTIANGKSSISRNHVETSYRFPGVPYKHFAEQLTRIDMVIGGGFDSFYAYCVLRTA